MLAGECVHSPRGSQLSILITMAACATAHDWAVRLTPPIYVKPFEKRQKNDAKSAEAITEAASCTTMRFVPVKAAEQQALDAGHKPRVLLVQQRTQYINLFPAHLAEYGIVSAKSIGPIRSLLGQARSAEAVLPADLYDAIELYVQQIDDCPKRISILEKKIRPPYPKP